MKYRNGDRAAIACDQDPRHGHSRGALGIAHADLVGAVCATCRVTSTLQADPSGAMAFFEELLGSCKTLGSIADRYGINTLVDVLYLQQAILSGGSVVIVPGETAVGVLIKALPSATQWLRYITLGGNGQHADKPIEQGEAPFAT